MSSACIVKNQQTDFLSVIEARAALGGVYHFLPEGEGAALSMTQQDLLKHAKQCAAWLQAESLVKQRILLLFPPGLEFIIALLGCIYAGAVAVPMIAPKRRRNLGSLAAVAENAGATAALTTGKIFSEANDLCKAEPRLATLRWLNMDAAALSERLEVQRPIYPPHTLCYLQYTSGSTSAPKGVRVTHENVLANCASIARSLELTQHDCFVSWLPHYHDMGLVGGILTPLTLGAQAVFIPPAAFMQRPLRWFEAIARFHGTVSAAPNFAFEACLESIDPAACQHIDLSCWRAVSAGAEPIRSDTVARFLKTFAALGFKPETFVPSYGLAEATLIVSGRYTGQSPIIHSAASSRELVGCAALPGQEIKIVDPDRCVELPAGAVGEIWVQGPQVADGYWECPEISEAMFRAWTKEGAGPYLRTGDLGFMEKDVLFISGRIKDIVIIRGTNHYPDDIEETTQACHPALLRGKGAAFSVEVGNESRLVVVQEIERHYREDPQPILESIVAALARTHELTPCAVVLIRAQSIPRGTSGKVQRFACRTAFLEQRLQVIAEWRAPVNDDNPVHEGVSLEGILQESHAIRAERVLQFLCAEISRVLGIAIAEIDPGKSILALGIDSLSSIRIGHAFQAATGFQPPNELFFEKFSLEDIAGNLANALWLSSLQGQVDEASALQALEHLSDEEVIHLLKQEESTTYTEQI